MPPAKVKRESAPKAIVLVDDDRIFRDAVAEFLSADGYDVHTAGDGLEALGLIRKVKPRYIILDIVLPKLDGCQVCSAVRQDAYLRHTPIIACSALSPQDYRLFPNLSADAYVAKGLLTSSLNNIQTALRHFEEWGQERAEGQVLGYEDFRPHPLVRQLLLERRHWVAVLRAVATGVVELDGKGRILMANGGACAILGRKEGQLVGEPFSSFCPPDQRKRLDGILVEMQASAEAIPVRTVLRLGNNEVAVRLVVVVDENVRSLLVVFESEQLTAAMLPMTENP